MISIPLTFITTVHVLLPYLKLDSALKYSEYVFTATVAGIDAAASIERVCVERHTGVDGRVSPINAAP